MDRRSREARILAGAKAALTAHVGGKPSATEQALIDRAAWLTLHLAQIDAKAARGGFLSDAAARGYLEWSSALVSAVSALGLKAADVTLHPADGLRAAPGQGAAA